MNNILKFQQQCVKSLENLKLQFNIGPEMVIIKEERIDSDYEDTKYEHFDEPDHYDDEDYAPSTSKNASKFIPIVKMEEPKVVSKVTDIKTEEECKKLGITLQHIRKNMRNATDKRYYCDKCECSYVKTMELQRHMMTKHFGASKCKYCRQVFIDQEAFEQHMQQEELKNQNKKQEQMLHCCHECGYTSRWKQALQKHISLYHSPDQPHLICDACGKTYKLRAHFKQHFMENHMEKRLTCAECGKKFAFQYNLKLHIRDYHPKDEDKGYSECEICHKKVRTPHLRNHIRFVHKNIRSYECTICPHKSINKKNLEIHMKAHEKNTVKLRTPRKRIVDASGVPKVLKRTIRSCDECDMQFDLKADLMQHKILTHLDKAIVARDYVSCQLCKVTLKKSSIHMHFKTVHVNARNFKCDQCDYACNLQKNLNIHKMRHAGRKIYNCHICAQGFEYLGRIQQHFEEDHGLNYTKEEASKACIRVFK
ncbi:zinc finger protein 62 homolog [Culicoides brevitarsis]|uniref:zinc finger protein 62 homolog n=1 Tax=Culicoides brevitarsis TaxID=469753 RepID=UPI00307C200E